MSLIKIEAIKNEDKVSNNGKSYTRCSIKTIDRNGQETWISGFGNDTTKSWRKGQTVDLEVYSEDYQDKTYYKFKEPAERNVFTELDEIKAILHQILQGKKIEPEITVEEIEKTFSEDPKEPQMSDIPDFLRP